MLVVSLLLGLARAAPIPPGVQVAAVEGTPIRFVHSRLVEVARPTALDFGPDGRLYVATVEGLLFAYTIARTGPGTYAVTATERIEALQQIPNHDRDGRPRPELRQRLVTGIRVVGTPEQPVIYATSSDPRMGDKGETDLHIDNHSGAVSRLTRRRGTWEREELVIGLPRSNEDHAPHGIALHDGALYVAQGGNTNMGAPSQSFFGLPEDPLSAAVLRIDLAALAELPVDARARDPGPVSLFATGFRNPYDLLWHSDGQLYLTDNGPNRTWGGVPADCSDRRVEGGETGLDTLHRVPEGSYAGHPNPSRQECRYLAPGSKPTEVLQFGTSTNGLAEYTGSAFGGALKGDLLAVGFDGNLWRIPARTPLHSGIAGHGAGRILASGMGAWPLDLVVQGDEGPFPGTIWVAVHLTERIQVFEPAPAE